MAKRRYSSELREQQAASTRKRVVRAAAELFGATGYAATSLPQIARRAGVSTETVQAHGPKLNLLRAAIAQSSFAAEDGAAVLDTALGAELLAAPSVEDAARIAAAIVARVNQTTQGIWFAFSEAARADDSLAAELTALARAIRTQNRAVIGLWRERGWLREDVPDDVLAQWSDVLGSVEVYDRVVRVEGSTVAEYRELIARLLLELMTGRCPG